MKSILLATTILLLSITSFGQKALHLYGGSNNDTYLGCLNCSNVDANSIWNSVGQYGSIVSSTSIWNNVSTYGSSISPNSPWSTLASNPPVIVDNDGGFYGYLTVNSVKPQRADFKLALTLYKFHDLIRSDVSKGYDMIFR